MANIVTVTETKKEIVSINTPGPQGPQGPQGVPGPSGSATDISALNTFTGSAQAEIDSLTTATGSYLTSLPSGVLSGSAQISTNISGAFTAASSSFSTRTTTLESNPVFSAAGISGSFGAASSSFSTRTTVLESNPVFSAAGISGSFNATSASFSTRVTTNETITSKTLLSSSAQIASDISGAFASPFTAAGISGSFTAASSSFSTRITTNETITSKTLLSSSAQIASDISGAFASPFTAAGISGSFTPASASFSTRVTSLEDGGSGGGFTAAGISGSLGPNATLIRSLTASNISGSFNAASSSFSTRVTSLEDGGSGGGFTSAGISGSWQGQNFISASQVTPNLPSGTLSSSAQIASDISGAFASPFTAAGISGSFNAASSSFSTRTTALESNPVFTAAGISGSFNAASSSFSTRTTTLESNPVFTAAGISGSFNAVSSSFSTRTTTLESNPVFSATGISGSFTLTSSSLASRTSTLEDAGYITSAFPFTGDAQITGSLIVSGSFNAFRVATTNLVLGTQAGENLNPSATGNVILGNQAGMEGSSTTQKNVFIGDSAGETITGTSRYNVFLGLDSGKQGSGKTDNIGIGFSALKGRSTSDSSDGNVAIGYSAAQSSLSTRYTVAIGYNAVAGNASSGFSGYGNIGIGRDAISNLGTSGGAYNTAIGYYAGATISSGNANIIIGSGSRGEAAMSNQLRIGHSTLHVISGSLTTGDIIFYNTASAPNFSGSFQGDGSNLTNLPASNPFPFTGDAQITGSLIVSGSGGLKVKGPFELSMTASSGGATPFSIKAASDLATDKIIEIKDDGGSYDLLTLDSEGALRIREAGNSGEGGGVYIQSGGTTSDHANMFVNGGTARLSISSNTNGAFTVVPGGQSNGYLVGLTGKGTMALGKGATSGTKPSENNTNTLYITNGTNPTNTPTDSFALFSKDVNSGAGTASPTFLTEDDTTIQLGTTSSFSYVSASAFKGDGSQLTGIVASTATTASYVETSEYTTRWNVTNNGSSGYYFDGNGVGSTDNNPDIYLTRGEKYLFNINAASHPFAIRVANGGSAYNDGVTNNEQNNGDLIFEVQMDAPTSLVYQCTIHGGMVGNIYIADARVASGSFSGSFQGDGSNLTGVGGDAFPFTGDAQITGSLIVSGSTELRGSRGFATNVVIGQNAQAASQNSVAIGNGAGTSAGGSNNTAIGDSATLNNNTHFGTTVGQGSSVTGTAGIAYGYSATSAGEGIAIGRSANASTYGLAIGKSVTAGTSQLAIGYQNTTISASFTTGRVILSGSTGGLELIGSGSTMFEVIGSEGTLFAVDDDLDGTIFTANDRTGLPVLQAEADGEVYLGKTPQSLYTTAVVSATSASSTASLIALSTSSYDSAYFDFTCISASNSTVGSIMSTWNEETITFNEYATSSIGTTYRTAGLDLQVIISASQAQLVAITDSTSPNTWKIKTTVRAI